MPKFVIEREIPGVGQLPSSELQGVSQKSCDMLRELGPQADDRIGDLVRRFIREHH